MEWQEIVILVVTVVAAVAGAFVTGRLRERALFWVRVAEKTVEQIRKEHPEWEWPEIAEAALEKILEVWGEPTASKVDPAIEKAAKELVGEG